MNTKLILFLLQIAAFAHATSSFRYKNRMVRTHESLKQTNNDCLFNICENDPYYPEDAVKNIVNQHRSFHSFLTGRVIEPTQPVSIFGRDNKKAKPFCKTVDVQVVPKRMMDVHHVSKRIVNVKNHSQILKYQKCSLEGNECFKETILDIKTKCMQKYNNIKLVTVDVNDRVLEYGTFKIPTTCVCTYVREFV